MSKRTGLRTEDMFGLDTDGMQEGRAERACGLVLEYSLACMIALPSSNYLGLPTELSPPELDSEEVVRIVAVPESSPLARLNCTNSGDDVRRWVDLAPSGTTSLNALR